MILLILFNSTDEGIENYKNYCEEYNMAILNLNKCFEELRKEYQIAKYLYFYVALLNFKRNGTNTPQFDFIIYNQYGVKYRNEMCNEIKISKSFKNNIVSSDLINKYTNSNIDTIYYSKSNKFYNDICFTCSNDSYDILLEDRYEIFHNNTNYYFCEDNCNITNINFSNFRVDCVCSNISSFNEYNKKEYGIYKEEKIIYDKNFQFMKCSNLLFNKDFFTKNYGNYIVAFFFLSQITSFIIFFKSGLTNILLAFSKITFIPPLKSIYSNKNNKNSDNYNQNTLKIQ